MLSACNLINRMPSSVLYGKISFLVFILTKVSFPLLLVYLIISVLFRSCLQVWINCLLDLSNVSLSGIIELRKDIGATIYLPESILCLLMFHFFSLFHIFFCRLSSTSSPFVPLPPPIPLSAPVLTLDVSSPVSQTDTTRLPALKPLG